MEASELPTDAASIDDDWSTDLPEPIDDDFDIGAADRAVRSRAEDPTAAEVALRYPRTRKPDFFARFTTFLMTHLESVPLIGKDESILLLAVAAGESKVGHRAAARFTNTKLLLACGLSPSSKARLWKIRRSLCVDGWLHYGIGRNGTEGVYFVSVPSQYLDHQLADSVADGFMDDLSLHRRLKRDIARAKTDDQQFMSSYDLRREASTRFFRQFWNSMSREEQDRYRRMSKRDKEAFERRTLLELDESDADCQG